MPNYFKFTSRETGEVVSLNQVDKELCEETGQVYSETNYCPAFQWTQLIGGAILCRWKEITEETFKAYQEKYPDIPEKEWNVFHKFLLEKYHYDEWYSPVK